MVSDRLENYKEFAKHMEYPMVIFSGNSGEVIEANYEAQTILGQNVSKIIMKTDKFMYSEDFWGKLHRKKSLIWHRILLLVDGRRYVVSGIVNEFEKNGEIIYMVLFELRTDMNIGSVTLERIVNHAGLLAIYLYKVENNWKVRYVSKNVNRYGYTSEQFYEESVTLKDLIYKEDELMVEASMEANVATKIDKFSVDFRIITESENLVPVNATVRVVRDDYGISDGIEILISDMSKVNENELQKQYLEKAFERMRAVLIVKKYIKGERKLTFISSNANLLGMNVAAIRQGYRLTDDYIHPEDREKIIDKNYGAIEKGVENYVTEYRMVGDDGKCIYVSNSICITRISEDEAQMEYLITDITEQHLAKEKLLETNKNLEKQVQYLSATSNNINQYSDEFVRVLKNNSLNEVFKELANVMSLYTAVVDRAGNLVSNPAGPVDYMGDFYDMFERPYYRNQYLNIVNEINETKEGVTRVLGDSDINHTIVFTPIIVDDTHLATWLWCAYTPEEEARLEMISKSQETMAKMISAYVHNEVVNKKEEQQRKMVEMELSIELKEKEVLQDISKHNYTGDLNTLDYLCERAGEYLDIESLSILKYDDKKQRFRYTNSWASADQYVVENYDVDSYQNDFKQLFRKTLDNGMVVIGSRQIETATYNVYSDKSIKAIMAFAIYADEQPYGIVMFAEGNAAREWTSREIKFAKCISNMISGVVTRRENYNSTHILNTTLLNSYNQFSEYIIIKDRYSDEILYVNKATTDVFCDNLVGKDIKEIINSGQEKIGSISKRIVSNKKETNWQKYISKFNKTMDVTEIKLEWLDGRKAILLILKDVKG